VKIQLLLNHTVASRRYMGDSALAAKTRFYDLELFLRAADWQRRLSADDLLDSRIPDGRISGMVYRKLSFWHLVE
jgi:hypothetical protein